MGEYGRCAQLGMPPLSGATRPGDGGPLGAHDAPRCLAWLRQFELTVLPDDTQFSIPVAMPATTLSRAVA